MEVSGVLRLQALAVDVRRKSRVVYDFNDSVLFYLVINVSIDQFLVQVSCAVTSIL